MRVISLKILRILLFETLLLFQCIPPALRRFQIRVRFFRFQPESVFSQLQQSVLNTDVLLLISLSDVHRQISIQLAPIMP